MSKRVMTVDDSATVRQVLQMTLEGAGYEVLQAVDGVDALIDSRSARDLIHHRERRLKRTLARLDNPRALETWSGAAGTQQLSYRWQQAQIILQDILRGLGKEQG